MRGPVWLAGRGSGPHVGVTSTVTDRRQPEGSGASGRRCSCRCPSETNISRQQMLLIKKETRNEISELCPDTFLDASCPSLKAVRRGCPS